MSEWKNKEKDEQEIDLGRLAKALLRWSWLIVVVAVIFGLFSYIYSANFITPTYRSTFTAYVLSREPSEQEKDISVGELNASIGLANAYGDIIRSRSVLNEAAKKSGYQISYGELASKLTITASETTAILTVHVDDSDPTRAYVLAKAITEIAPFRVKEVTGGGTMNILDAPDGAGKAGPSNIRNAVLGALIGLLLACVFVIVKELFDDKVQSSQDLEQRYHILVIGSIPEMGDSSKGRKNSGRKVGEKR